MVTILVSSRVPLFQKASWKRSMLWFLTIKYVSQLQLVSSVQYGWSPLRILCICVQKLWELLHLMTSSVMSLHSFPLLRFFLGWVCAWEEGTCQVMVCPSIQRGGQDLVNPLDWMTCHLVV
jgi:hypothetical protein